jgi:hypothetical protein
VRLWRWGGEAALAAAPAPAGELRGGGARGSLLLAPLPAARLAAAPYVQRYHYYWHRAGQ